MEITLTSAELADLLTEAKRNGAHGAPDYDIYHVEDIMRRVEHFRTPQSKATYADDDTMCNGCGYPEHTCKCS